MIDFSKKQIVLLAPHTDDIELSMGGTLDKLCDAGCEISLYTFCNAFESLPKNMAENTLIDEAYLSWKEYNQNPENLHIYNFPVRNFDKFRQDILEILVNINTEVKPDIVFCPAENDVHQDHGVITTETKRAFKATSILGYQLPWNYFQNPPMNLVSELTEKNLKKKTRALFNYRSQAEKSYFQQEYIRSWARYNGGIHNFQLAELFQVIRLFAVH